LPAMLTQRATNHAPGTAHAADDMPALASGQAQ
jgi:hypothetical protein